MDVGENISFVAIYNHSYLDGYFGFYDPQHTSILKLIGPESTTLPLDKNVVLMRANSIEILYEY